MSSLPYSYLRLEAGLGIDPLFFRFLGISEDSGFRGLLQAGSLWGFALSYLGYSSDSVSD